MTSKTQNEMNIAAVLDAFTYLNVQGIGYKGMTLGEIFSNSPCGKDWSCYEAVRTAVANDENLAGMRLVSQSDLHTDIPSSYITACTFVSADGRDYYVAYKGTGDGQWPDDGQGLYQKNTVMQKAAAQYFDEVVDELHLNKEHNIIVTGHSKGGNEAQFVTMAAQHSDLIDSCYSIDGQGFSQKARKSFQEELGDEEYQARRNKMYSINSQNDYVHGLGIVIIPNDTEHTIYLSVPPEVGVGGQHALEHLLYGGRLDLAHPVEAGPLAQFIDVLSAEIMQLSEEDIQDCAMAIMSLIEILNGGSPVGVGDVKSATLEEYCGLISVGIPLILKTAVLTEEGRALLGMLAMNAIKGIAASENGVLKLVGITVLVFTCAPAVIAVGAVLGTALWGAATLADIVLGVFDDKFERSDIAGAAIIGKVIASSAVFMAANPQIVITVLTFVAVISFITFVIDHWDDISAFAKAAGDFAVGAALAIYAWAENLAMQGTVLIKSAIGWAVDRYRDAKQAVCDFGDMLLAAAAGFFSGTAQAITGALGGFAVWIKNLFGSGGSALAYGNQIVVTISYIEDIQGRIRNLRSNYLALSNQTKEANGLISHIYSYYKEPYVRNRCRSIQAELKSAQKYVSIIERNLDRKRKVLSAAVESYKQADRNAANDVRSFASLYT